MILRKPASDFIANFMGMENMFSGTVEVVIFGVSIFAVTDLCGEVRVGVRPEDMILSSERFSLSARNSLEGVVCAVLENGVYSKIHVDCGGVVFVAALTRQSVERMALVPGILVWVTFKETAVHVFSPPRFVSDVVQHHGFWVTASIATSFRFFHTKCVPHREYRAETYYNLSRTNCKNGKMKKNLYYRVDQWLQNGVIKYYLLLEINSDTQKFRATKLIKCGTLSTDAEVARIILLHGFDLEVKCCEKVAAYRVKYFKYHFPMNEEAYTNLEKYWYLDMRYHEYLTKEKYAKHGKEWEYTNNYIHESTKTVGNTFTLPEIYHMLDTDKNSQQQNPP